MQNQGNRRSVASSHSIDPAVSNLERELRALKLQEKKYSKLTRKMQELQKKSQMVSSKELSSEGLAQLELEEIQKLKESIDECIADTHRLEQEYQEIDKQIDQSNKEISSLAQMLERIQCENASKRESIRQKGESHTSKQKEMEVIMEKRDYLEKEIQELKEEVHGLTEQQYRLKKDAEVVEFQREQEQNVKKNLIQYIVKMQGEKGAYQLSLRELVTAVQAQNSKYQNLKQEMALLKLEEEELGGQLQEKQNNFRNLSEGLIRSRQKNEEMEKQLVILDQDIRLLSEEYLKETELQEQHETRNIDLNQRFDNVCRDATEVWSSLKELLQLAENHCQEQGYSGLVGIRRQAREAWNKIQQHI